MSDIPKQTQDKDREVDSFDQDLHQNYGAGVNRADRGANPDQNAPSAYDMKEIHSLLPDLSDEELRRVVLMPEGSILEQGAVYLDLRHMDRGEFKAEKPEVVGPPNLYLFIPKQQVDYVVWNKLRGVTDPERLDQADDSSVQQ